MFLYLYMKWILFLIIIITIPAGVFSQEKLSPVEAFEQSWLHQKIDASMLPPQDLYGRTINYQQANMLILGFNACIPCRKQMPHIINFALTHPEETFIYLTYDDKATIEKELSTTNYAQIKRNFYILQVDKIELDASRLANFGYPMKYFFDEENIVRAIDSYTDLRTSPEEMYARWLQMFSVTKSK